MYVWGRLNQREGNVCMCGGRFNQKEGNICWRGGGNWEKKGEGLTDGWMALLCKFFNFYWFFIGIGIWLTLVKYMHTYNTRYFDQEKVMLVSTTSIRLKRLNILQELIPSNIAREDGEKNFLPLLKV